MELKDYILFTDEEAEGERLREFGALLRPGRDLLPNPAASSPEALLSVLLQGFILVAWKGGSVSF